MLIQMYTVHLGEVMQWEVFIRKMNFSVLLLYVIQILQFN